MDNKSESSWNPYKRQIYMGPEVPNPDNLRKVEKDIVIPKIVRERAHYLCAVDVQKFLDCSKREGVKVIFNCRRERDVMVDCIREKFEDPDIRQAAKEDYLKQRSQYQETGVARKRDRKRKLQDLIKEGVQQADKHCDS